MSQLLEFGLLISCLPNRSSSPEPLYMVVYYVCEKNDDAFIQHFQNRRCLFTLCRDPTSEPGKYQYRCIFEKYTSSVSEDHLIIKKQRPKYCHTFYSWELGRRCWADIVGRSSALLDHRCPSPVARGGSKPEPDNPDALKEVELLRTYMV